MGAWRFRDACCEAVGAQCEAALVALACADLRLRRARAPLRVGLKRLVAQFDGCGVAPNSH